MIRFLRSRVWLSLLADWWQTRSVRMLLGGLPAILIAGVTLVSVYVARAVPSSDLVDAYRRAAIHAIEACDFEMAELCFRRLDWLQHDFPVGRFELAQMMLEDDEKESEGLRLMSQLAPEDAAGGFAPAHFWMARRIGQELSSQDEVQPNQAIRERERIKHHLTRTVELDPGNVDGHLALGQLYLAPKQLDEGIQHLEQVAEARPPVRLVLCRLYNSVEKPTVATEHAELAEQYFGEQISAAPENVVAWLKLVEAIVLQQDYERASRVLEARVEATDDAVYPKALTNLYLAWAGTIDGTTPKGALRQLALMQAVLQRDSGNEGALNRLARLATLEGDAGTEAREFLEKSLVIGAVPPTVHLILGSAAAAGEDLHKATFHLERAFEMSPDMSIVANNLAWVLCNDDPPQLDRALTLVNQAIKSSPGTPEMLETRGQIFARMGEWKSALSDLEVALPAMPDSIELHTTLGDVYEHLELPSLAAKHRQVAQSLLAANAEPARPQDPRPE